VIPEDAITQIQGGAFVWVVVDGKAERRRVELGVRTPGYVEIRNGITPGDQVVVGGLDRLVEGATVEVMQVDRTQERVDSVERQP
jgi:membrane fusion protein (multidrug efflux system)